MTTTSKTESLDMQQDPRQFGAEKRLKELGISLPVPPDSRDSSSGTARPDQTGVGSNRLLNRNQASQVVILEKSRSVWDSGMFTSKEFASKLGS